VTGAARAIAPQPFGKTPAKGAQVPLNRCVDAGVESGTVISDKGKSTPMPAFIDATPSQRLGELNAKLAGL
jgi:hypothetical protein